MKVVVVHSHLNPGGVTRIIESQIDSLQGIPVSVLVGSCSDPELITSKGAGLKIFEPLNYLEIKKFSDVEANLLLNKIMQFFENEISRESILHYHNPNLGKNPIATYAVYLMARNGVKIFNHAHDFAEDRPANYTFLKEVIEGNFGIKLKEVLYPQFENYHFGILNSFDYERLQKFGIQKERIEWLPNPVTITTKEDITDKINAKKDICNKLDLDNRKSLVTYPVRVIRRKNIGELILFSVLFSDKINFVVTQPPKNPVELKEYNKWLDFCRVENIEITFEAGNKVNFEKLLIASDFCISTSYREGFGMVFLEPWLLNTPVVGRDIDYITRDFINDGFQFSALYQQLLVPGFKDDFKELDINIQMGIISGIKNNRIQKGKVFEQNPILNTLFEKVSLLIVTENKKIIENNYSLKGYGAKLQRRYKKMVG